jgi:hypothetical protein
MFGGSNVVRRRAGLNSFFAAPTIEIDIIGRFQRAEIVDQFVGGGSARAESLVQDIEENQGGAGNVAAAAIINQVFESKTPPTYILGGWCRVSHTPKLVTFEPFGG